MSASQSLPNSKIEVKQSKFLGFCFVLNSEEEVKEKIASLKKEYKDATMYEICVGRHFI